MSYTANAYGTTIEEASRPIYWNLPSIYNQVVLYVIFAISLLVFANGVLQRIALWNKSSNSSAKRPITSKRLLWAIVNILFQRKVSQDSKAGIFHALIFLGFMVLFITTTAVFLQHDLGIEVFKGYKYIILTVGSDAFGLLFLLGIGLAYKRRYIDAPDKLHSNAGDRFMLAMLAWLVVQGFLLEGLRIHSTEDPWAHFSFVGLAVSKFFWATSIPAAEIIHFSIWWLHAITFFVFLALLPYTKFFHIIASSLNLFFIELDKPKGALRSPGDIASLLETAMESGAEDFSLGTANFYDLNWKTRLDLDACTSCGRCQDVCPAYNTGKILSPKWLILDARDHMLSLHSKDLIERKDEKGEDTKQSSPLKSILAALKKIDSALINIFHLKESPSLHPETYRRTDRPLPQGSPKTELGMNPDALFGGGVMDEDVFWSCTTCRACMEVCPVAIEHVDLIVETRRNLLLIQGSAPAEAQPILRAIESQGTPIGTSDTRADWTKGLSIPFVKEGDSVDILYWVGCISAFDTRKQKIAKAMSEILNASKVSWGMLGNLERCTGDPARRLGDENTFQQSAKSNIEMLRSLNFNRIVTHCPHCFNTIKNEYPDFGNISDAPYEILHHSTYLQELISNGEISLEPGSEKNITFHDPCYLGRYNDVYEEPREILVQLGTKRITEMKSNKKKSMCCGAGGGHYWFDMKVGERVNVKRVEEALETGSDTIASACPFCMQMLEDGIKLSDKEDTIQVRDIAELVRERMIA